MSIRTHQVLSLCALLVALTACSSGKVEHPDDVKMLLADRPRSQEAGFHPVPASQRVAFVPPPPEAYRIGVADVVYVSVPGQEQFVGFGETAQGELIGTRVKEDGHLYLPVIRKVPAQGKTVVGLQQAIREKLGTQIDDPFVSVDVLEFHSQKFYVLGEVHQPGAFPVNGRTTLVEAILQAAGTRNGDADLEEAYIIREGKVLPISLEDVLHRGDIRGNIPMRDRDLVFVPHVRDRRDFVYVLGEVQEPGAVPMEHELGKGTRGDLTLAAAIAAVGGLDLNTAAEDQIRIFRGGWKCPRVYTLSSHEVYMYGESLHLHPGDRVLVAPTGLATWGRALGQGLPFLTGATSALALAATTAALQK